MENKMTGKNPRVVNLHHLFWSFLEQLTKKWHLVLLAGLIGALIGAGYAVLKNMREDKMANSSSEKISVTEEEFETVKETAKVYDSFNEQKEYNENSILMKCGELTVFSVTSIFKVTAENEKDIDQITAMYLNQFEGSSIYQKIAEDLQEEINVKFLKEVFECMDLENGIFKVKAYSFSSDHAEKMMEAAEEYLDGYYQQGKKILKADYSIEVISRESTEVVDSDIRDKKDLAETALLQLQEEYDNAVSSLSENELQYLNSYLEERNQAGYTEGEALDKTDISLLEDTGNGIAVKRIKIDTILGLMLGICCVLGYFIIAYCWSSVLVNGEELTSMYGLPVLGYVNQKENRKKIEWYFLKKKKKNVVFTDLESECRKIMERLQLQVSEGESIYLLSLRETEEKYQKVFIQEGRKQGISMTAGNGIDGISQNLKQADKILLIEEEGVSRYHEIEKEIALCYEAEKKICGTVIAV